MVGQTCREAREEQGISLRCAAREMGYSPQSVSLFERGMTEHVHLDMLCWYAKNTNAFGESGVIFLDD